MSDKKIALVTGASRGIGKSIADRLGRDGFIVIGTATSQVGADAISERFKISGIDGVGKALVTPAAGLILGFTAMLVHSYFRGRVNDLVSEMESRCGRVLRGFVSKN